MNKLLIILISGLMLIFLFSVLTPIQAQISTDNSTSINPLGSKSNAQTFSLLDPSRFKLYQSYSFSYFSGGGTNGSLGIYTTTLNYQISNPLSLTLSLNYLHQPLSVAGRNNGGIKNAVLPNFQLYYRPNSSFSFMINVVTCPSPNDWGNYYPWYEHRR
ncbi:MAG TPA: hypothetical protein VF369_03415 [candidate division Zixibacteria bacterium]